MISHVYDLCLCVRARNRHAPGPVDGALQVHRALLEKIEHKHGPYRAYVWKSICIQHVWPQDEPLANKLATAAVQSMLSY